MTHLFKFIFAFVVCLITYALLSIGTNSNLEKILFSTIMFFISILYFYGEGKIYPKFDGELVFSTGIGIMVSLFIAYFISNSIQYVKSPGFVLFVYLTMLMIGVKAGLAFHEKPGLAIFGAGVAPFALLDKGTEVRGKILDTSVVIDGRILDIADTHFIDGPLILPNFVLREIQLISDSSDPIKRARGRRGLDMLNKLQRKGSIEVKITYTDYADTREVDAKLIKLARDTGAKLVTNDFNLNKVAELQGVKVLNLNNLANALKPVVLPGEELQIQVIKEGKDENQGIGYLEDGTMVVIENGGHLVNKEVKVTVTSIIQTAAGKMIFTKATR
ncbi:MAG: TRAM domain-containing protein [Leptospiraceae bacterium]|nr:TRAM domain-containing protein [Leptospiraceae bacterium]MCP5494361.1 TRAM domain-containing protein [Leptospiraceae bacterium]